jgi:hypothetical protein
MPASEQAQAAQSESGGVLESEGFAEVLEALQAKGAAEDSDALQAEGIAQHCECPSPSLTSYLAAALVGALSLAVIVAGLMIGWNLGQPDEAPVLRPGGSPGLPVAQPADDPGVTLEESSIWGSITLAPR